MLQPKKYKYPKMHANRLRPLVRRTELSSGVYGIVSSEPGRVTARQLEAARRVLSRGMGRSGKVWLNIFPHQSHTDKPMEARMGKGKGAVDYWAMDIPAGTVVAEVSGISDKLAKEFLHKVSHKLAVRAVVRRRDLPLL